MLRKWTALLIAMAFLAIGAPSALAAHGEVTIALTGEPPTMDPHVTSNFIGTMTWRWAYDTLISSKAGTGEHVPWLATKWKRLNPEDTKFWLRKDAKFRDGTPVTAAAVKFSMNRILDPKLKSRQKAYWKSFDHIEILDDYTFIWHNKIPDNGLMNRLVRWVHIMNPKAANKDEATISRNSFGSGPYYVASWTKGQKLVFKANPTWWGAKDYPNMPETVVLRRIAESATRVKALITGEVDVISAVMPQFVKEIQDNPKTEVKAMPSVRIMYLSFFEGKGRKGGPFANRKVRLAVNYAINSAAIRKTLLGGRADAFGSMLHPWNYSGYNPNDKWYPYNLAKAKQLMKEAGYAKGFDAQLIATSGRYPSDRAICEAISGMVKRIGINAPCNAQRFPLYRKTFRAIRAGKSDKPAMYFMAFGNGAGASALVLRGTAACDGAWSGTCMPDLDAQINKAAATADPPQQQKEFEKVTHMMKSRATHVIIAKIHDVYAYQKGMHFQPRHDESLFPWLIRVKK